MNVAQRSFRLVALAFLGSIAHGQTRLPAPTGNFSVGRTVLFWVDQSRHEQADAEGRRPRELAAFFYYPAEATGQTTDYFPGLAGLVSAPETKMLQLQFGSAWQAVAAGAVRSHAHADARFVSGRRKFPVLIFSPGLGVPTLAYSVQLEDLASRGYVVVALEHGNDAALIIKPDHTLIPFVSLRPSDAGPPSVAGLEADRDTVIRWTADTTFAIDQIEQLSRRPETMFFGRINMSHLGVFGHSAGGKAAARVCQTDSRVRACLNQDGELFGIPFGRDEPIPSVILNQPTKGPFVDIYVAEPGASDAQLAAVHVTRKQYSDWRNAKTAALRKFLSANSRHSFLISIKRPGYVHGSFMDISLLRAMTTGAPTSDNASNLKMGQTITEAFFDATLRNQRTSWNRLISKPPEGLAVDSLGSRR